MKPILPRVLIAFFILVRIAAGESMLQYFNTSWAEVTRKMPELAEAGYQAIWLPPPTKGSGGLSVGYDLWDPFDLGSKDQRGSVATRYGTEAELLQLVATAHRFGIRIYFDNIMNHRAFDVPGYNESTPIDIYPGMAPEDFHLRVTEDGFYRKWDNTRDWNSAWQVQNLGLADLIDIAHESPNTNFGRNEGDDHPKYSFIRHPNNPETYCFDRNGNYVGFGNVTSADLAANPEAYKEDVNAYLIRNVRWLMDRTKADGLRLDAVKHVPDYFFGQQGGFGRDNSDAGYLGGVQRQFNISRGFSDANHRDSVFDTEAGRDDAMVFGEHLGSPPGYSGYWDSGMRLVDNDLRSKLNGVLGNPSGTLAGLDSSGGGGFPAALGVMHANSHDSDYSAMRQLQHALYFTREGMGLIYTDGYYQAETLGESGGAFPRHANTAFLGQFGDPRIPNLLRIHQDFARGIQQGRWGDSDFLAYERRDNRNPDGSVRNGNAADEITMVVMLNDNSAAGQSRPFAHSFPNGAYLYQYATGPNGSGQTGFYKYGDQLGSTIVPPGGYFVFGYRTPELSTLWPQAAITLHQDGREVPNITVTRKDGPDGDAAFNPEGLSNRGYPTGVSPKPFTYRTTVPVVKSGSPFSIIARADGSAQNILLKLDGGVDLNGTVPAGITDPTKRDNPPAVRTDIWAGYEQPIYADRQHPELFAAKVTGSRDITGSLGAETYTTAGVLNEGSGSRTTGADTASFLYHDPTAPVDGGGFNQYDPSTRRLWAKVNSVGGGYRMFVYYTTDSAYFPEGAGGIGKGNTRTAEMNYQAAQSGPNHNWWASVAMPDDFTPGVSRYKIGIFKTGSSSWWPGSPESVAYKKKMLTTFKVENFSPSTVQYHEHADYNSLTTGLKEGFHVLRAKAFLDRNPATESSLYQTFTQTFYYDSQPPSGQIAFPQNNGETVSGSSYEIVVRTDSTVEEVWYNIADSEAGNDDSATSQLNGNGTGFEPFTDLNRNGVRDSNEDFTDMDGDGTYDISTPLAFAKASAVTANPSPSGGFAKEWRIRFTNIPASGAATLTFRLLEASSSRDFTLDAATGHYTTLIRTVNTAGPLERINIAYPQNDGDLVDDNYTMKVYFSKALANGLSEAQLKNSLTFMANGLEQGRSGFVINYGSFGAGGAYHELSVPLPNLYNDVADFMHELVVKYTFPANYPDSAKRGLELSAVRRVRASPSSKPYVQITQPAELGSDGKPVEIILPDGPGPDATVYTIRVVTSASVTSLTLNGSPELEILNEAFTDSNGNLRYDGGEPYTDANSNGAWDGLVTTVTGNSKTWDYPWRITSPGNYLLVASTVGAEPVVSTRNARVVLREIVATDADENNDDDDDGLIDLNETNPRALPTGNPETWTNADVHVFRSFGRTLPNTADSDGDGLPDGVEVGWRTANNPPTSLTADTNGDGFPNFIGDMDPPLFAVVENHGFVPSVGSQSQGDDRARQAAGSVTDPTNPDTDADGLPDGIEDTNRNGWTDGDGKSLPLTSGLDEYKTARPNGGDWPNNIIDSFETWAETSPTKADSDGDGLNDGYGEDKDFDGSIAGDANTNRTYDSGESWTETNPLKGDTDGDGLPDGWEVQYGLDPLDNGSDNLRTAGVADGNPREGGTGDPDGDSLDNAAELAAGTNPSQVTVVSSGGGEGTIRIGTFTDWKHTDLLALDEYNEGGSQGADVFRTNGSDPSRDIVAFSFRDGGAVTAGGDGKVYFRIDFMDLAAFAEQGEVDAYVVIDTGNPATGERALPDNVDIATDMKWEVVVGAYSSNSGSVSVDLDRSVNGNTTTSVQNPYDFGVVRRGIAPNGLNAVAWSRRYDAMEMAVERQALTDGGWLGDPATLNFQVFTTKDGTASGGAGDLSGRNDIRDTIGDDWLASDYWKDQESIRLNGKLSSYFGRSSSNDRGKAAKVMLLAHGNQAMEPGNKIQNLLHNGTSGYQNLLQTHEAHAAPLSLHITPTLASALQWAKNPAPNSLSDGPSFNARIAALTASGGVDLLGSTFSDHIPKYFPADFNTSNIDLSETFLDSIYGANPGASRDAFWAPERVLDDETLEIISDLGYSHTFADQSRHFVKWFGRTSALGTDGFRINEVNGIKIFPIHDTTSEYLNQTQDEGSSQPVRELLSRRSRSSVQDQVVVLWRDMGDFANSAKSSSYDTNVRWLASRPWIRVVTAGEIISGEVPYIGQDNNTYTTWGTVTRGTGRNLVQTAKDFIDHATGENYGNWFFGSGNEEGLQNRTFGASSVFGQIGASGHSNATWQALSALPSNGGLSPLASASIHSAMFQTAFHNTANDNLSKFSTGAYIYPDTDSGQTLADFARIAQSQTRFAKLYARANQWAAAPPSVSTATAEDIDLDGANEYLLFNNAVFAVFEAKGGRMTAGFSRNTRTGRIYQVIGTQPSFAGSDSENEGETNVLSGNVAAFRTSGFKDWFANGTGGGTSQYVNATYSAAAAGTNGWIFTAPGGNIVKTITLPNNAARLDAIYSLSGGVNKLYVRMGLSPDLGSLMTRGQQDLVFASVSGRISLSNPSAEQVAATVRYSTASAAFNASAIDDNPALGVDWTTVNMRNQAFTQQVELENVTGQTTFSISLGMETASTDNDSDGLPDWWENKYGLSPDDNGTTNINNGPAGDSDLDGVSNFAEWLVGLVPNSKDSGTFPKLAMTKVTGGYRLSFPTLPDRKYQVMASANLSDWAAFGAPIVTAPNDSPGTYEIDTTISLPKRFFRMVVSSAP